MFLQVVQDQFIVAECDASAPLIDVTVLSKMSCPIAFPCFVEYVAREALAN